MAGSVDGNSGVQTQRCQSIAPVAENAVMAMDETQALADVATRRSAAGVFDNAELSRRVDDLGDMALNSRGRHDAFAELYAAFTPSGFRFVPFPNECAITATGHRVYLKAVIIDDAVGQVVAEIVRDVLLDQRAVVHELLKVQDVYRGVALSYVLLNQAFPLYRQIGLERVLVHAAMETGRWHWARLGFDFLRSEDRQLVMAWALAALAGLGQGSLDPSAPARRLAQLGTGSPQETVSMEQVRAAVETQVATWRRDGTMRPRVDALVAEWNRRSRDETGGQYDMLDPARVQTLAARNKLQSDEQITMGKALMLTGPDWWGTFDLHDHATTDAFNREFSRRFSTIP
jgi:hypothetical protein